MSVPTRLSTRSLATGLVCVFVASTLAPGCKPGGNAAGQSSASVTTAAPLPKPDPTGADLVKGTIVAAAEKAGGIRLYKVLNVRHFPKPVGPELVLLAFQEKTKTFAEAQQLWKKGKLTVALNDVRTDRAEFNKRDRRIIATQKVDPKDLELKRDDTLPAR